MKLITPFGLLVTTALLAIYGAGAANVAVIERSWPLAIASAIAIIACVGTAFMQRWSQYPVYLLTTGFVAKWCLSLYEGYSAGYFAFQFESAAVALRSLVPGFVLVILSGSCSWMVRAHFRRVNRPDDTEPV